VLRDDHFDVAGLRFTLPLCAGRRCVALCSATQRFRSFTFLILVPRRCARRRTAVRLAAPRCIASQLNATFLTLTTQITGGKYDYCNVRT
jgi:hypothetical protein